MKSEIIQKILIGVVTAVALSSIYFVGGKVKTISAAADKCESVEQAQIATTEFISEQRTSNQIQTEKWEQQKVNDERQWQTMLEGTQF